MHLKTVMMLKTLAIGLGNSIIKVGFFPSYLQLDFRVDLSEASTLRAERGFLKSPEKKENLDSSPHVGQSWAFLSIEDLTKHHSEFDAAKGFNVKQNKEADADAGTLIEVKQEKPNFYLFCNIFVLALLFAGFIAVLVMLVLCCDDHSNHLEPQKKQVFSEVFTRPPITLNLTTTKVLVLL